jgi:hypothetical protein
MLGMQQSIGAAVAGILHELGDPSLVVVPTLGGAAGRLGFLVVIVARGCGDRYRCHSNRAHAPWRATVILSRALECLALSRRKQGFESPRERQ